MYSKYLLKTIKIYTTIQRIDSCHDCIV